MKAYACEDPEFQIQQPCDLPSLCCVNILKTVKFIIVNTCNSNVSIFNRDEGTISLCLLVDNPMADPGVQVHCRLIEAYCWECAIPVIKVRNINFISCIQRTYFMSCIL